jgi:hypothetical protein
MKKRFIPVDVGFTNHGKINAIEMLYGTSVRAYIISSLIELWTQRHFNYPDGIIK